MTTFLVAHASKNAQPWDERVTGGVAQATIIAKDESEARDKFATLYPGRKIMALGIKGVGE